MPEPQDEIRAIEERYARHKQLPQACLDHALDPHVCHARNIWNNPKSPEVRGVPVRRIRQLFPGGSMLRWSVTLAPRIEWRLRKACPALDPVDNPVPLLRTHVLCWIQKPRTGSVLGPGRTRDEPHEDA